MGRRLKRPLGALAALVTLLVASAAWPTPQAGPASYAGLDLGPVAERHVYWVGHSLMSSRDPAAPEGPNVIETVGALADAAGLAYSAFDHTLWGSSLSLAYRGRSHAGREEPELAARRSALQSGHYDTLVLTDTVPIDAARRYEGSAYYAARFACEARARVPDARVYLYESWVGLQGVGEPVAPNAWDWRSRLEDERRGYEALADEVSAGGLAEPGWLGRWTRWWDTTCRPGTVFLVPVGTAFRALSDDLEDPSWERPEGTRVRLHDFFANPYVDWPEEWPSEGLEPSAVRARVAELTLRHDDREVDDVHPSALGIYFVGLVHFATLFRRSPEGLPAPELLLDHEARRLQHLVWDVVRNDPRAGVR
ncbi:MAG: hypothetical protein H6721_19220 [Sandaracinus sp.]|nr:hypothetical protein [Sandaracinus sp.]MCB9616844.1 hypothetical protein [Sandaracinus sp.]MCB9634260.1 hypothetical protein [Sandaracinus sp.]